MLMIDASRKIKASRFVARQPGLNKRIRMLITPSIKMIVNEGWLLKTCRMFIKKLEESMMP
jgi:hypothetical protein